MLTQKDFESWDLWDEFCAKKRRTPEEWVLVAEQLVEEHDGTLPNVSWLRDKGYRGLSYTMRNHPDLFKHIKQDRKIKTPEEWVLVAEQLVKEHEIGRASCRERV